MPSISYYLQDIHETLQRFLLCDVNICIETGIRKHLVNIYGASSDVLGVYMQV